MNSSLLAINPRKKGGRKEGRKGGKEKKRKKIKANAVSAIHQKPGFALMLC